MKFGCPYEGKGCPFMLEARHSAGTASVDVWQTGGHEYHDPTSAAERGQLKMHPALLGVVTLLLRGGNKPAPVCTTVNNMVLEPGDPLGLGIGGGSLSAAHFSNGRTSITKEQVYAVKKRLRRDSGFGLTSDPQAIAAFVAELEAADSLGHYQAYKAACGTGRARQPEKPLIVVVQTPFQKRLLNEFGRRLVFLDTTFGTNRHGFPLSALLVRRRSGAVEKNMLARLVLCCCMPRTNHSPVYPPPLTLHRCKMRRAATCPLASWSTALRRWRCTSCSCARCSVG